MIYQNLENNNTGESVWNLFVQILLPLIMILIFASVSLVLKYKDQAEEATNDAKDWAIYANELQNKVDPDKTLEGVKKLILRLQLQKLLRGLKEVEIEQRKSLELTRYQFSQNINMNGLELNDPDFKAFCGYFRETVFDRNFRVKRQYYEKLYAEVLEKTSLIDNNLRKLNFEIVEQNIDDIISKEFTRASERIIIKEIQLFVTSEIVKIVNSFIQEMVLIQKGMVSQIFEIMTNNPGALDDHGKKLIEKFMKDPNPEIMKEFYRWIMKVVIKDLKSYHILPNVISEINSI